MEHIYHRYGDQEFWYRILDQIYKKLLANNETKHFFEGKDLIRIKCMHVMLLSTALQRGGDHFPVSVSRVHKKLQITERIYGIYTKIYENVLRENGIQSSDIESIMSIIWSFESDIVS